MSDWIVQTQEKVTLIGAGPVNNEILDDALTHAPMLVAVDGGAEMAQNCGKAPKIILGDLDSASNALLARFPRDAVHHIAEQDTTDFQKALAYVDAPLLLGVGFLGGRADHQMAVLNTLGRNPDRPVVLVSEHDVVFALHGDIRLDLEPGTRVSLYPLAQARVDSKGLRWPLNDVAMATNGLVSQSNEVAEGPLQLWSMGGLLVFLPRQALSVVLEAVTRSRQTT